MPIRAKMSHARRARLWQLVYGFLFFCLILLLRLFYLQVDQWLLLNKLGERNFLKTETILPIRGNFYDCNHTLLAANKPIFDLYWQGLGGSFSQYQEEIVKQVLQVVGDADSQLAGLLEGLKKAERYARSFLLKQNVNFGQLCKVSEQCSQVPNLVIKSRFERYYPHKNFASHIVGYLSRVENVGCDGLEKLFDQDLGGQLGYEMSVINSTGRILRQRERRDAQAGQDLTLTLDYAVQRLAESAFESDQTGALIVMDPETGAIRALASYPNFDPNHFVQPISESLWKEKFTVHSPLLNRATAALYPPASTFKLVTVTAGLEEGVLTTESEFNCQGFIRFGGRKFLCQRRWGHGTMVLQDALAHSCNILCFEAAKHLPIDTVADYACRFGLGYKTDFLLPEKSGLVPTSHWKRVMKGEGWWPGDTLSVSIGQSYLLVTPLQIARMYGAVCTGFLVKPRILESEEIQREELNVSAPVLDFLRQSMYSAVQKGTVWRLRHFKNFKIFAKTGTAQTCSLNKEKTQREHFEHAWLTGFFEYKEEKPLVLIVLLEYAGGSRPAILIAHRFLDSYQRFRETGIMPTPLYDQE
ncbi:penicillin-binding protein 2 [bacterium]|nr:MAG: penicillin-binding protein 2 [bacterium]